MVTVFITGLHYEYVKALPADCCNMFCIDLRININYFMLEC